LLWPTGFNGSLAAAGEFSSNTYRPGVPAKGKRSRRWEHPRCLGDIEVSLVTKRRCVVCRGTIKLTRRNPDQHYCAARDCQRERRRRTQKHKRSTDPDYRENDLKAQREWRKRNPQYQKNYRQANPQYTQRNLQQQHTRDKNRRGAADAATPGKKVVVNVNVSKADSPGAASRRVLANEDSIAVEISL
jgi:hypothetical protein